MIWQVLKLLQQKHISAVAVYKNVPLDTTGIYLGGGGVMPEAELPETLKVYEGWVDAAGVMTTDSVILIHFHFVLVCHRPVTVDGGAGASWLSKRVCLAIRNRSEVHSPRRR